MPEEGFWPGQIRDRNEKKITSILVVSKSSYSSSLESEGLRFLDAPSYRDLENWMYLVFVHSLGVLEINSISSRFFLTSGHLLIEEVVARRAAKFFSSSCSKLSKTLIANFWSLRSVQDDILHSSGLHHID